MPVRVLENTQPSQVSGTHLFSPFIISHLTLHLFLIKMQTFYFFNYWVSCHILNQRCFFNSLCLLFFLKMLFTLKVFSFRLIVCVRYKFRAEFIPIMQSSRCWAGTYPCFNFPCLFCQLSFGSQRKMRIMDCGNQRKSYLGDCVFCVRFVAFQYPIHGTQRI